MRLISVLCPTSLLTKVRSGTTFSMPIFCLFSACFLPVFCLFYACFLFTSFADHGLQLLQNTGNGQQCLKTIIILRCNTPGVVGGGGGRRGGDEQVRILVDGRQLSEEKQPPCQNILRGRSQQNGFLQVCSSKPTFDFDAVWLTAVQRSWLDATHFDTAYSITSSSQAMYEMGKHHAFQREVNRYLFFLFFLNPSDCENLLEVFLSAVREQRSKHNQFSALHVAFTISRVGKWAA